MTRGTNRARPETAGTSSARADVFGVTVDALVSERDVPDLLRDQSMIERWRSLDQLPGDERDRILYVVDGLIRDAQARRAYAAR